jgi:beta-glucosidase-like glycosyl hydrolase
MWRGTHGGAAPRRPSARTPYLVGIIGTAYVLGLQASGVDATLKHFADYSASRGGRNMAPVSIGRREFADVILPPFEMAIRLGSFLMAGQT